MTTISLGSRKLIDADRTEDLVLCEGDKCVAGSDDLVHPLDALSAERERRDGLRATCGHHLAHAEQVRGGGDQRMHTAGGRRRAGDHDVFDAGDLRGNHRHEHGARVCRAATRDVASDPPERHRVQPCSSRAAIEDVHLQRMELAKPLRRGGERIAQRLFESVPRRLPASAAPTRDVSTSTPSIRYVHSRSAASPPVRTSAMISRTASRAPISR